MILDRQDCIVYGMPTGVNYLYDHFTGAPPRVYATRPRDAPYHSKLPSPCGHIKQSLITSFSTHGATRHSSNGETIILRPIFGSRRGVRSTRFDCCTYYGTVHSTSAFSRHWQWHRLPYATAFHTSKYSSQHVRDVGPIVHAETESSCLVWPPRRA